MYSGIPDTRYTWRAGKGDMRCNFLVMDDASVAPYLRSDNVCTWQKHVNQQLRSGKKELAENVTDWDLARNIHSGH